MPEQYVLFDLQFFPQSAGRYSVAVTCPLVPGDAVGEFVSPAGDPGYIERFARLQALDTDEDLLIALGRQLFDALFQDKVRDAYTTARDKLGAGQGLRLRFNIDPRQLPEVAGLPWEFLCDTEENPLVLYDTPIVRYLPRFAAPPTIATPRPLKILVSAAVTEPKLDVTRELEQVRATLAELEQEGAIEVAVEEHLTIDILDRRLREGFHLWHFIGHGKLNRDGTSGLLVFEDAEGGATEFSARDLRVMLNAVRDQQRAPNAGKLQVIILDACNSAQLTTRPYRSIAPALMLENIGAVIAMQFKTPMEATRPFARGFYQALIAGEALDTCVMRGRRAVSLITRLRNPDWGIPTVYTRAPDARLFEPAPAATTAPATPAPAGQPGGVNISLGNNNTLIDSPISVNPATDSRAKAEDDTYAERLNELLTQFDTTKRMRSELQKKKARAMITIGEILELEDTEKRYDSQLRELLTLRHDRQAQLERRAARAGGKAPAQLAEGLADLRAAIVDETLDLKQRELHRLEDQRRIQPNDRDRARVQAQLDAVQAEIDELRRQRNG